MSSEMGVLASSYMTKNRQDSADSLSKIAPNGPWTAP